MNKTIQKHQTLIHEHFFYRFILQSANIMFVPFYLIALYKEFGSFGPIFLEEAIYLVGLWIGVVIMPFAIEKVGYRTGFKISFFTQAISFLLVFILFANIRSFYIFLGLVRGIGRGTYWAISNLIDQKELKSSERGRIFNLLTSINLVQSIALPLLVGAFITYFEDFSLIALIVFLIHFIPIFVSWESTIIPASKIQSSEITKILKLKNFYKYISWQMINTGLSPLLESIMLVIPFIFLKSDVNVGLLITLTALLSAFLSFKEKDFEIKKKYPLAVLGYFLLGSSIFILGISWSIYALLAYSLFSVLARAISLPVEEELKFVIKDKTLGKYKNESAIEFNLSEETFNLFGRIISYFVAYYLIVELDSHLEENIRIILIVIAFYKLLILVNGMKLYKKLL